MRKLTITALIIAALVPCAHSCDDVVLPSGLVIRDCGYLVNQSIEDLIEASQLAQQVRHDSIQAGIAMMDQWLQTIPDLPIPRQNILDGMRFEMASDSTIVVSFVSNGFLSISNGMLSVSNGFLAVGTINLVKPGGAGITYLTAKMTTRIYNGF